MALSIPTRFNDALSSIGTLDSEIAGKLAAALTKATPSLSVENLLKEVNNQIGTDLKNGTNILELLLALHKIEVDLAVERTEFLVYVAESVSEVVEDDEVSKNFNIQFEKLFFDASVLKTCAKAVKLFNENSANPMVPLDKVPKHHFALL